MKAHIGVDEFSGLVHHVTCTAANVGDVTIAHLLLHGDESSVLGDSGYKASTGEQSFSTVTLHFSSRQSPRQSKPSAMRVSAGKCRDGSRVRQACG